MSTDSEKRQSVAVRLSTIGWSPNSETATKWTTTHRNGIDAHELLHARAQPAEKHACCANKLFFFEGGGRAERFLWSVAS